MFSYSHEFHLYHSCTGNFVFLGPTCLWMTFYSPCNILFFPFTEASLLAGFCLTSPPPSHSPKCFNPYRHGMEFKLSDLCGTVNSLFAIKAKEK